MAKHVHRSGDYTARYGGEEFIVLLSNTTISGAAKVGEDIRLLIENLRLPHKSSDVSPYVTVSVGVMSLIPEADRCVEDLVKKADQALYYAKRHGRNCVITEILRQYFINHPQSIDKYTFLQNSAFTHWVKEKCSKMC